MNKIGIKLADGTFYPILEEGTAKTYQLDLTTVKDGQTKVQIDLYRSKTNTMEDAEYLDTLEVTNLVPHLNGEADLHLSIGLNEDNELDAKIVDEETGKQSETTVTLVSRTLAERAEPTNFELVENESLEGTENNDALDKSEIAETVEAVPFSFDSEIENSKIESNTESSNSEAVIGESEEKLNSGEGTVKSKTIETAEKESEKSDIKNDIDFTIEDADFNIDDTNHDEIVKENTEEEQIADETVTISDDDFFGSDTFDKDLSENEFSDLGSETFKTTDETISEKNDAEKIEKDLSEEFSIPDIDDEMFDNESFSPDAAQTSKTAEDENQNDDTTQTSDDETLKNLHEEPVEEEFSLPDFDTTALEDSSNSSTLTTEASGLAGYFDDPDFKEDPVFTQTNLDTSSDSGIDFDTSALDSTVESEPENEKTNSSMDFSDLYDKETLNGQLSYQEDEEESKTRVPMIICIICAIICVIATFLILFIVPSKYNLIKSRNTKETKTEQTMNIAPAQENPIVTQEPPKEIPPVTQETPAPKAVEDTIVVAKESEKVVPVPEPAPKVEKKKDIKYRIRWGDTLWDIADAYYKNPWRYPKIAKYNKIKNPNLIISGTDILIPVE
ncbi:LysM peptidoglycan-binding domain-containing protein [Treponema pectinovorum]|uniref:LysM peptidoglycan-binding domain-containing protein n=1 Tax=Treponema pectinovorum TaxID=164 RepID=UPI0021C466B7|nr:LysM peptidoglycan-binding domain-containing protein [Treponema pectinovorum]